MPRISSARVEDPPQPGASDFLVSAPGRVNLIGEHTDYNDGLVLPMAIERQVELRVRRRSDRQVVLRTAREAGEITLDLTTTLQPQAGHWSNYVAGVVAGFQKLGWEIPGFELDVDATLPAGGGLSSSAALEVATATAIETLCGRELPREKKALLCQKAEHQFAGVPCGIMDQFAVTFAEPDHALLLDCQSRAMRHVPLSREVAVLVINSGVKHRLADGEYARRRITCQNAARILGVKSLRQVSLKQWHGMKARLEFPEHERARHVITEHERTLRFVEALERSDWEAAGDLMYGSHESLRDDYEVSCLELDLLVEISRGMDGVYGCRMTGGGFGGCVVALIEPGKTDAIMAEFRTNYLGTTRIDPAMFVTRAVGGPHVEIDPA